MSSPTTTTPNPTSLLSRRPAKPSLKITPLVTPHIALPPADLTVLVHDAIRAQPSPRRNLPEFKMQGANPNPEAPPPTPTDESCFFTPTSSGSSPRSEKKVRFYFPEIDGPEIDGPSPRSSEESIRSEGSETSVSSER